VKILVLGSNGFIGSNVLQHFRSRYPGTTGCDVVAPAVYDDNFLLLEREHPQFEKIFLRNTFDVCINASGSGSVPYSIEHPDEDYRLNAKNVFEMLTAISRFNMQCRFLNFSSAAVYGNPESLPVSEKSRTKPLSPYGFHKLISEQICSEFYHLNKIRTCSMRVFSVYGPCLRKQLFWDIYQKSKHGDLVDLFGTGEETRDFIYISDLVQAIECILENGSFEAEIINVASGTGTSIHDAAGKFLAALGSNSALRFTNINKQGDPGKMQADIGKLKSYGFSPAVDIDSGLSQYADWIKQNEN
jgi:UDP-glucose 4-epimerase